MVVLVTWTRSKRFVNQWGPPLPSTPHLQVPESARALVGGHRRRARGRRKQKATQICLQHLPHGPLQLCHIHCVETTPMDPGIRVFLAAAASDRTKIHDHRRVPELHDPFLDLGPPRTTS